MVTSTDGRATTFTERLAARFYAFSYRRGRPPWDRDEPFEALAGLVDGLAPAKALDLGCGTGSDALALADRGWTVTGVDLVPQAIDQARARAEGRANRPTFVVGDATRLGQLGLEGPFDLVLDVGCFHAVPAAGRPGYAAGVAALTRPGAHLYLAGVSQPPFSWRLLGAHGLSADEVGSLFGPQFSVAPATPVPGRGHQRAFTVLHLVRQADQA